jgi:hypothetical protein
MKRSKYVRRWDPAEYDRVRFAFEGLNLVTTDQRGVLVEIDTRCSARLRHCTAEVASDHLWDAVKIHAVLSANWYEDVFQAGIATAFGGLTLGVEWRPPYAGCVDRTGFVKVCEVSLWQDNSLRRRPRVMFTTEAVAELGGLHAVAKNRRLASDEVVRAWKEAVHGKPEDPLPFEISPLNLPLTGMAAVTGGRPLPLSSNKIAIGKRTF